MTPPRTLRWPLPLEELAENGRQSGSPTPLPRIRGVPSPSDRDLRRTTISPLVSTCTRGRAGNYVGHQKGPFLGGPLTRPADPGYGRRSNAEGACLPSDCPTRLLRRIRPVHFGSLKALGFGDGPLGCGVPMRVADLWPQAPGEPSEDYGCAALTGRRTTDMALPPAWTARHRSGGGVR